MLKEMYACAGFVQRTATDVIWLGPSHWQVVSTATYVCSAILRLPVAEFCALWAAGMDTLCTWLRAELFMTNFRPVPLTEHVVFQGVAYRKACLLSGLQSPFSTGTTAR